MKIYMLISIYSYEDGIPLASLFQPFKTKEDAINYIDSGSGYYDDEDKKYIPSEEEQDPEIFDPDDIPEWDEQEEGYHIYPVEL